MKNFKYIVLLLLLSSCSLLYQKEDFSKLQYITEYQDSIVKVTVYKDTLNYKQFSDTLSYIYIYQIIDKDYSILYRCENDEVEKIKGEIVNDNSIFFDIWIGPITDCGTGHVYCFKELKKNSYIKYNLLIEKNDLFDNKSNINNYTINNNKDIIFNFSILFVYIENLKNRYNKDMYDFEEPEYDYIHIDSGKFYINDRKELIINFQTIEKFK